MRRFCLALAMAAATARLRALHERTTVLAPVCIVVCPLRSGPSARALAHAVKRPIDFRACAVIYIPKRNKSIPKRNKLTFLSMTFDIPKRDGHVRTYTTARIHPGLCCLALMRSVIKLLCFTSYCFLIAD